MHVEEIEDLEGIRPLNILETVDWDGPILEEVPQVRHTHPITINEFVDLCDARDLRRSLYNRRRCG